MVETLKNLWKQWTDLNETWQIHQGRTNDDPWLHLTYFTARSNLVTGFSIGKVNPMGFSETIAACELKVGRCRQIIE